MKIRPLQDRIVVKRLEGESKTKGGIIIPDTAQEKPMEGKVISVGSGVRGEDVDARDKRGHDDGGLKLAPSSARP